VRALLATLALLLALVAGGAGTATAAEPRTTLPDVEDEVMCVECGTALNVSSSAVAEQEREFIRRRIAEGMTKEQVKGALVAEYGPRVLAEPEGGGFDWAAWVVPTALALLGVLGVALAARRWRRGGGGGEPDTAPAGPALDPAETSRLDADLAAFDR
jgi:cytochrome c-type biogenesis protein CcmH